MSQHDMNIANQGFPAFRADLNDALGALVSNSSGATAPSTTFAHQLWVDTAADPSILKIRNADNDAWITIGSINQTDDKFKLTPADGISTDTISELTSAAGVTVDGVLLKDSGVGSAASPVSLNSLNYPTEGSVNFRNRIINGAMVIDQRNAGASIASPSNQYTLDRWYSRQAGGGVASIQQSSTAPAGFTNSLLVTVTTADAIDAASDRYWLEQKIEGYNTADLGFGSASAKTVTLSFWVRSSVTGTYAGAVQNGDSTRAYIFTYSISSANTWEQKSITIAGDTSGTWYTNTSTGIAIKFNIGSGTDYQGTANTWDTTNYFNTSTATNLISTNGATFYITGVQLEVGSVATPFERRPYGTELSLCQRYYYKMSGVTSMAFCLGYNTSTTVSDNLICFPVTMRVAPSALEQSGTAGDYQVAHAATATTCSSVPTFQNASLDASRITGTVASGLTTGQGSMFRAVNTSAFLAWSAEL